MKIGVWLPTDYRPEEGGGFSYFQQLIQSLDEARFEPPVELVFVATSARVQATFRHALISLPWEGQPVLRLLRKAAGFLPGAGLALQGRIDRIWQAKLRRSLAGAGVHVLYYPLQMDIILPEFPYICTSWDIGHLNTWAFPEMTNGQTIGPRRRWYREILPGALMVFAESEAGKRELTERLSLSPKKIRVIPMFTREHGNSDEPGPVSPDLAPWMESPFFFYPAQFWPHKNHINLLRAFAETRKAHSEVKLILTGSDKGNRAHVQREIHALGLTDSVCLAGFVDQADIDALYRRAVGLVMPTFLGPTNLPLIEALHAGCPVACSDFEGHREMLGDAALYFDPASANQMAGALAKLLQPETRKGLVEKLEMVRERFAFRRGTALERIAAAFSDLVAIRANWP